uniref:Uncharacterized protein n=1 Tax=Caulobacter phage BL57 TaxID=3348355 RepID=A0AB74UIL3_9VIRU
MPAALTVVSKETENTTLEVDLDDAHGRLIQVLNTAAEAGLGEMTSEVYDEIKALLEQASEELSSCGVALGVL